MISPLFVFVCGNPLSGFSQSEYIQFISDQDDITHIINVYEVFRNKVFHINNQNRFYNNEIHFVCIRNMNDLEGCTNQLDELFSNTTFGADIDKLFSIDIIDGNSADIAPGFYKQSQEINTRLVDVYNLKIYNLLFTEENANHNSFKKEEAEIQVNSFLQFLHEDYRTVYGLLKQWKKTNKIYNSFGSSFLFFPNDKIKETAYYFNNAAHFYYLLSGHEFNNKEFDNILRESKDLQNEESKKKLLEKSYSNAPDTLDVISSVNKIWADCNIDEIKTTFNTTDYSPFSNFAMDKGKLSLSTLEKEHKDFIYNHVQRISDSHNLSDAFFLKIISLFRDYKNDELISIQRNLNRDRKSRNSEIQSVINDYFDNTLALSNDKILDEYGKTTVLEAISKTLSYLAFGSKDNVVDHDKNFTKLLNSFHEASPFDRTIRKREMYDLFYQKNEQYREQIQSVDDEIEFNIRQLDTKRKQLQFKAMYPDLGFMNLRRYSFLSKLSVISSILFVCFFMLSYSILNYFGIQLPEQLYWSFGIAVIPVIIGVIMLNSKRLAVKQLRKAIDDLISNKLLIIQMTLENHDILVKNYVQVIKEEYTYQILKDTQNYIQGYLHKIEYFRRYLFDHYLYSVDMLNTLSFDSSIFDKSFVSKEQILEKLFGYQLKILFLYENEKLVHLWKIYLEKSNYFVTEVFEPISLNIEFFYENEKADELVASMQKHRPPVAQYSLPEDIALVPFLANNPEDEPIQLIDINQGEVGDCYFLASLGAIAHNNPEYIKHMIYPLNASTEVEGDEKTPSAYLVRFFNADRDEKWVAVDDLFWFYSDGPDKVPVYSKFGYKKDEKAEIWPMIIEKAWAKANGGYTQIDGSSSKDRVLDFGLALSGNLVDFVSMSGITEDVQIQKLLKEKSFDKIPLIAYSNEDPPGNEVDNNHAYVLHNFDSTNNTIDLYNPHGERHLLKKSITFLKENFDAILYYDLQSDPTSLIEPKDRRRIVIQIDQVEEIFDKFIDSSYLEKILMTQPEEYVSHDKFEEILKMLDDASEPMIYLENYIGEYSIAYTKIDAIDRTLFRKPINNTKESLSEEMYFGLTKYCSWSFNG